MTDPNEGFARTRMNWDGIFKLVITGIAAAALTLFSRLLIQVDGLREQLYALMIEERGHIETLKRFSEMEKALLMYREEQVRDNITIKTLADRDAEHRKMIERLERVEREHSQIGLSGREISPP